MGSALRSYSAPSPRERADEGGVGRRLPVLTAFRRQPRGPIIACSLITWDVTSFIVCGPANRLQGQDRGCIFHGALLVRVVALCSSLGCLES